MWSGLNNFQINSVLCRICLSWKLLYPTQGSLRSRVGLYTFSMQCPGHPIKKQITSYDICINISPLNAKPHHKSFLLGEYLLERMQDRCSVLSYLSPNIGLLPTGGQGKPSFWNSLSCAEYGLFPRGMVYIPQEAAVEHDQKANLWRHLSKAARWTKGGVGLWWWYLH